MDKVRRICNTDTVAVLWVQTRSIYLSVPGVECWGVERDARKYDGPWPVVAHPPCGPWGKLAWLCRQSREDGVIAMSLVHKWGGVVEQPVGSALFKLHGEPFAGQVETVWQGRYGHPAPKPTWLYWVRQ